MANIMTQTHALTLLSLLVASSALEIQQATLSAEEAECPGDWPAWPECSVSCGGGFRMRKCASTNAVETEVCGTDACPPMTCHGDLFTTSSEKQKCHSEKLQIMADKYYKSGTDYWAPGFGSDALDIAACESACAAENSCIGFERRWGIDAGYVHSVRCYFRSGASMEWTDGDSVESDRFCTMKTCVDDTTATLTINCAGTWGDYGECSVSCGGGTKSRPFEVWVAKQGSGDECVYVDGASDTATCNTQKCPPLDCYGDKYETSDTNQQCGSSNLVEMTERFGKPYVPGDGTTTDAEDLVKCEEACAEYDACIGFSKRYGKPSTNRSLECTFTSGVGWYTQDSTATDSWCIRKTCQADVLLPFPNYCVSVDGQDLPQTPKYDNSTSAGACKKACVLDTACSAAEWYPRLWKGAKCKHILGSIPAARGAPPPRWKGASCFVKPYQETCPATPVTSSAATGSDLAELVSYDNLALGGVAFASGSQGDDGTGVAPGWCKDAGRVPGEIEPDAAGGKHCYWNINDGKLGDDYAWVGETLYPGTDYVFVGVRFAKRSVIQGIRVSRGKDDTLFGGLNSIEYSTYWRASHNTSTWCAAGSFTRTGTGEHWYKFSEPIVATGLRLKLADKNAAIDELVVYGSAGVGTEEGCDTTTAAACTDRAIAEGLTDGGSSETGPAGCYKDGTTAHYGDSGTATQKVSTATITTAGQERLIGKCTRNVIVSAAKGDPHFQNMLGVGFDVMQTGNMMLLEVPRGSKPENLDIALHADIEHLGVFQCGPTFITNAYLTGRWLGTPVDIRSGQIREKGSTSKAHFFGIRLAKGEWQPHVDFEQTKVLSPQATIVTRPRTFMLKVDKLSIRVMQPNRPRVFLDVQVKGIDNLDAEVGGLLGIDDHSAVEAVPEECM